MTLYARSRAPAFLMAYSNAADISYSGAPTRVAFIIALWASTPSRPTLRRWSISAGDLIERSSQMNGEASLTVACGKRSRRFLTNCSSRVRRPSQRFRVIVFCSVANFSADASRASSSGLNDV